MRNTIIINGAIDSDITYSHTILDIRYFQFNIRSQRLSGVFDIIPCIASEELIKNFKPADNIQIIGIIRSYTNDNGLNLNVQVKHIEPYVGFDTNEVVVSGFLCKEPKIRSTNKANKTICDLFIANNRNNSNQQNYIPLIAWNDNAILISREEIGTAFTFSGRLQNRERVKKLEDGTVSTKTVYEVSINIYLKGEQYEEN